MLGNIIYLIVMLLGVAFGHSGHSSETEKSQIRPNLSTSSGSEQSRLILLSFDGFRFGYFNQAKQRGVQLPNFDYLIANGAFSEMLPSWPTKTFANHFTLVTGVYPGEHRVLFSDSECPYSGGAVSAIPAMRKRSKNEKTRALPDSADTRQSVEIQPIWLTNERTAVYFWPCAYGPYGGRYPLYHVAEYNISVSWRTRVDTVVDWLVGRLPNGSYSPKDSANLALLYIEEPDEAGHMNGPESEQLYEQLVQVDNLLGYLIEKLKHTRIDAASKSEQTLFDHTNLLVVSDHGMSSLSEQRVLDFSTVISNFAPNAQWTFLSGDPVREGHSPYLTYPYAAIPTASFNPFAIVAVSQTEAVNKLVRNVNIANSHMNVYTDQMLRQAFSIDMALLLARLAPSFNLQWTFEDGSPLLPVLLLAQPGWSIRVASRAAGQVNVSVLAGAHGYHYESPDMRAIALGFGPAFRKAYSCFARAKSTSMSTLSQANDSCKPLLNVDIYALMCSMLRLSTCHNVTLASQERASRMLAEAGANARDESVENNASQSVNAFLSTIQDFYSRVKDALNAASPGTIVLLVLIGVLVGGVALAFSIASCSSCRTQSRHVHRRLPETVASSDEDEDVILSFLKRPSLNGKKSNGRTMHYNMERRSLLSEPEESNKTAQEEADSFV